MIDLETELRDTLVERAHLITVHPDVDAVERDAVRGSRRAATRRPPVTGRSASRDREEWEQTGRRRYRIVQLVAAGLVVTAGIGAAKWLGDDSQPSSRPSSTATVQAAEMLQAATEPDAALRPAVEAFMDVIPFWGGDDGALYGRVREHLITECMASAGFDYTPQPWWESDEYARMLNTTNVLRPVPMIEDIRQEGYAAFVVAENESAALTAARAANQQLLSGQAAFTAMEGPAAGPPGGAGFRSAAVTPNEHGCNGAVLDYMNTRVQFQAEETFNALTSQTGWPVFLDNESGDPDVDALTERWVSCMAEAGFGDYDTGPYSLPNRYRREIGVTLTPEEIDTAVADATCQTSTGFHDDYVALVIQWIDEWFVDNEGAIIEVRAALDHDVSGLQALAAELGV